MTTETVTPHRSPVTPERESFWSLVHAEWTKFRTVRGWVIAVLVTIVAIAAGAFLGADVSGGCTVGKASGPASAACPAQPTGPGGVPVQDVFYFAHQPVTGDGTITVQMTSLTGQFIVSTSKGGFQTAPGGLQPWSKAGIIIKENTSQGSAYAAMMVTASHGVRMQWDYVNDTPGLAGRMSAASPRWLRLVRDGGTITGYDSADGTHWTLVGTAALPRLTSTVQAGLFAAGASVESYPADFRGAGVPDNFGALATGVFRHIRLSWPATGWTGTNVGGRSAPVPGTLRRSAATLTVTGDGDISPAAGNAYAGSGQSLQRALAGTLFGLIPLIVVAAMFITAEYRRGLIRVSLTAVPRRGRLLAVAAVLALAIGTIVRRSAAAVAIVIVVIFVPYLLAFGPLQGPNGEAPRWPLLITPAAALSVPAALSVQQAVPQFHQLIAVYSLNAGYYPLAPWAGLAVECAWAAAALTLAFFLLRRRDA